MNRRACQLPSIASVRCRRAANLPHASAMHAYGSLFHPAFMSEIFNN